ncbi:hypothetical protein FOA52_001452 [Chlamydomonas sp. UWO 241]|nr:hypothetical protein FOA52_001452 [Chlamydomonas sp. UWO 241]
MQAQLSAVSRRAGVTGRSSRAPVRRAVVVQAKKYEGTLMAEPGMKFGVVVARFNSLVTKALLEGAMEDFEKRGVKPENVDVAWVPGSFELPMVAKMMAKSGKYDAVVGIGAVIMGSTKHFDAVVGGAVSGCMHASTDSGVPVIFGVLTTDTLEQALDRSGGKIGNKGGEAAFTAVEMATLMRQLRSNGCAALADVGPIYSADSDPNNFPSA